MSTPLDAVRTLQQQSLDAVRQSQKAAVETTFGVVEEIMAAQKQLALAAVDVTSSALQIDWAAAEQP
jgi:hypothetical protein